jgi:prepilin-type N-terminal cleavage/methylation domain-containing protein
LISALKPDRGFTLVEIAVAIAILGIALTTLITMQTRNLDRYIHERSAMRAALYARYIMTFIEVDTKPPELGGDGGVLESKLDELGFFEADIDKSEALRSQIQGWTWKQEVQSIGFELLEDVLRRVDLTVSWGEGEPEEFHLVYFARVPIPGGASRAN